MSKVKRTDAWKKHISQALKGRSFRKGYHLSEEHKKKIGLANKLRAMEKKNNGTN